jgi:hypothetical protein
MSIHSVTSPFAPPLRPSQAGATATRQHAVTAPPSVPVPVQATITPGAPREAAPVVAPPGTDPALWSVLSEQERAFFSRVGAMGPLTYGRVLTGEITPPTTTLRGGRLDIKV